MEYQQQVVLITGADGFTGRYVSAEFGRNGYRVVGIVRDGNLRDKNIYRCDICQFKRLEKILNEVRPDIVVHLAGISSPVHRNVEEIYEVNIIGTRNLLTILGHLEKKPKSVIVASSANVYGENNSIILDESMQINPKTDYAISKCAAELLARSWMDRLPIWIVRPFNYTGVGQSINFLIPKIVDHFKRNAKSIELGNVDVERDFSDVRMVAYCYLRLALSRDAGQTINIASKSLISIREVIRLMETIAGYKIEIKTSPALVRENEIPRVMGCNKKIKELVAEIPEYRITETLTWMYNSARG